MNDSFLPQTTISINGAAKRIAYTFLAIRIAEQLTGINLLKKPLGVNQESEELADVLFAGLSPFDSSLTREMINQGLKDGTIPRAEAFEAVREAWEESIGEFDVERPR